MIITVKLSDEFELVDVNCKTIEEWNNLTEKERRKRLQDSIDEIEYTPTMILDSYSIYEKK